MFPRILRRKISSLGDPTMIQEHTQRHLEVILDDEMKKGAMRETESNLVKMIFHRDIFLGQPDLVLLQQIKYIAIQQKEQIKNETLNIGVNKNLF